MSNLRTELIGLWINKHLKPLLKHASLVMPLRTMGEVLVGYGVSVMRGDGASPAEVQACVDVALAEKKPN